MAKVDHHLNLIKNELVALGVPKSDIVLAYLSPFARQHTEFTIA